MLAAELKFLARWPQNEANSKNLSELSVSNTSSCVYSGSSLLASHQIYGNLAKTTGYVIVAAPSLDRSPDRKWNNKNNKKRCTFQTRPVLTWLLLNIYISAGNHSVLHFLLWMCDFRHHGYSDWPHQAVGPQCSHTGDESG